MRRRTYLAALWATYFVIATLLTWRWGRFVSEPRDLHGRPLTYTVVFFNSVSLPLPETYATVIVGCLAPLVALTLIKRSKGVAPAAYAIFASIVAAAAFISDVVVSGG